MIPASSRDLPMKADNCDLLSITVMDPNDNVADQDNSALEPPYHWEVRPDPDPWPDDLSDKD